MVLSDVLHLTLYENQAQMEFDQRMTEICVLSVCRMAVSEAASASHYAFINLQIITFIVAIWVLSFSCCLIH